MTGKLMTAVALAGLIAGSTVWAFAQTDTARPLSPSGGEGGANPSQESLTQDDVDPNDPFGDLEVDTTAPLDSDMSAAELAELRMRCDAIVAAPDRYEMSYVAFCQTNEPALTD